MMATQPMPGIDGATIRFVDHLPQTLPNGVRYSASGEIAGDTLLISAEGVGRCRIRGGHAIDFCAEPGAQPAAVERFLHKNALLALIHQRGELPLHASAVLSPEGTRVIAFCGPSGAGKSTMAATFVQRGWKFFSDDMVRITGNGGELRAWPGQASMRLCPDAWQRLEAKAETFADTRLAADGKFVVAADAAQTPSAFGAIILLGGDETAPRLERLSGARLLSALASNVPGPGKLRALAGIEDHVARLAQLGASCPVFLLHGRTAASAEVLATTIAAQYERMQQASASTGANG